MIHLSLNTGYSFKNTFGFMDKTIKYAKDNIIGVADKGNTFSHYDLELLSKKKNLKPIYGVRLAVVKDATEKVKPRGQFGPEYIFIAKNSNGLKEIYNLCKISSDNFYYRGNLSQKDVNSLSENVIVIAEDCLSLNRIDYIALTTTTPPYMYEAGLENNIPFVAIVNNFYPEKGDHDTYELLVGSRNSCKQTYPQHILSEKEWKDFQLYKLRDELHLKRAIENTYKIAEQIEKIELPKAPMIKSKSKQSIEFLCKIGAKKKDIDIVNDGKYKERYDYEMKIIKEKEFDHYFLVVADMITKAKKKMLVGPGRGSAGGSLVCYILGITEIDPIKYDLLFERFIDINRSDLPDIDIDFPDISRDKVIKQLVKDYGEDKVKHIANISKLQSRSAIANLAKELGVPSSETINIKDSIIERPAGAERANFCIKDTFETTDIGKDFIKKFPGMIVAGDIENHPSHSSVHAAGIIVCNEPIHNFAGVNSRDNTVMLNKYSAEYQNLLKIDVLGLRTLAVLESCAKQINMDFNEYTNLPLNDTKAFNIFNEGRLNGIFQFEGEALKNLTEKMGIHEFEDIVAVTALGRPAALQSGGAARYIKYKLGLECPTYYGDLHKEITKTTYGIVIYQEQMLNLCRKIGNMSWAQVNKVRKITSKSLGGEALSEYKQQFLDGSSENGYTEDDALLMWQDIEYSGSYAFNRSHSVAYGLISYWTAYMKAHYPLEFVVACLNNEKDEDSSLKILRDAIEHDGIEYDPVDPDNSDLYWSVNGNKIIGGLTNIKGIGIAKANKIIKARKGEEELTPSLYKALLNPKTPFDIIYPCQHYFKDLYENPENYGLNKAPVLINKIHNIGTYTFIGQMKSKNVRDLNEKTKVEKRNGRILKDNNIDMILKMEDDTDGILCIINRFDYKEIGIDINDNGIVDESWYIILGEITNENIRCINIKNIMEIFPSEYTDKSGEEYA